MSKVRITAIRQTVYSDLMAKYENPIEHTCDIKQGQQWISIHGERPDGLCLAAWTSMCKFVEALAKGRGNFYDGWMRNPMSAMISCNDGFRPYSFYIETIEEQHSVATQDEQKQNMHRAPKDKASLRVQKLVLVIGKNVLPRRQIMADLGMRQNSRHTFINNYLRPALEQQMIVMAYPGTPNKPEQAYRLTAKGLALWTELTLKNSNIQ
ncbi:MAG: TIGR04076 family protein [Paludibacteraceae bacterium]|nr:TIGR04076 family protein [Paludibacteraceae bacterium]